MKNTKEIFDNNYIISEIKKHTTHKSIKIINELKKILPKSDFLTNEILTTIYNKSISIHQSNINKNGSYLEKIISRELENNSVQYKQQVTIDKNGIIINFNNKRNKCYHIIDFIIGENIEIGKSITNYKIISCKTTCRERWTQDNWTLNYKPKKYY